MHHIIGYVAIAAALGGISATLDKGKTKAEVKANPLIPLGNPLAELR